MKHFFDQVEKELPDLQLNRNEPMSAHTTFRIGGLADAYATPCVMELPKLLSIAKEAGVEVTVIGNGSNLLVSDLGIRGLVIEIGKRMETVTVEGTTIIAEAGASLAKVAQAAATAGLGGMEFAAGIPGSVGGAVTMNAGAYDGEIKDVLVKATVVNFDGMEEELTKEELDLSYRHSVIPEKGCLVTKAVFALEPKPESEIRDKMSELAAKRKEKQPLEYPSAGSTFKRPEGYFAGKLIMDAGLRGYSVGDAQVSEKHCGFVVNKGNATAKQVYQLIMDVKAKVQEAYGVSLEPEVKLLGDFEGFK